MVSAFQHERYGFELARQMMKLAGLVDPIKIKAIIDQIDAIHHPVNGICEALTARFTETE